MALNKTASEEASVFSKTLLPATTGSSFFRRRRTDTGSLTLPAKIGLHRVSDGPDAPQVAIIFVHGLGGHPVTTWSYQRNPSKVRWCGGAQCHIWNVGLILTDLDKVLAPRMATLRAWPGGCEHLHVRILRRLGHDKGIYSHHIRLCQEVEF